MPLFLTQREMDRGELSVAGANGGEMIHFFLAANV